MVHNSCRPLSEGLSANDERQTRQALRALRVKGGLWADGDRLVILMGFTGFAVSYIQISKKLEDYLRAHAHQFNWKFEKPLRSRACQHLPIETFLNQYHFSKHMVIQQDERKRLIPAPIYLDAVDQESCTRLSDALLTA